MERPSEAIPHKRILTDYKLEEMLWSERSLNRLRNLAKGKQQSLEWRHRVQYAVSHTINDYYSLTPEVRREVPIQYLLEKRWPKHTTDFESSDHFWNVKWGVTDELVRLLTQHTELLQPVLLYEEHKAYISDLHMDLSVIFQVAWQPDHMVQKGLYIQKYIVNYHEEVIRAYQNMMIVFCHHAFGCIPERIEVNCLLDRRKITLIPDEHRYDEALDYVKLVTPLCLDTVGASDIPLYDAPSKVN
ncbi:MULTISPECIES: hypothetical protein [unclassified Paenibacillus]|uniref:hypothetical protein n=1 Tax=unclassified Paenibacillus TaxID=185978 RepID=UPI00089A4397|nr:MULTISPECIES: hypothetical protein [unclassified Paenibacillus]OMC68473.1 hypothetical protein BK126_11595 [Paenibacillus sp. FSL H7-0326]SDW60979.1 hypothetical protein SAMN05518848_102379 [Paenibacillus sp. PDC88]